MVEEGFYYLNPGRIGFNPVRDICYVRDPHVHFPNDEVRELGEDPKSIPPCSLKKVSCKDLCLLRQVPSFLEKYVSHT